MVAAGELGDVRLVTGRYFQDWLLLESDWNWRLQPDRGGALRAVGDIGSHWLDLMTFVTGQHVTEVMADLTTFIGTRHEPKGPVESFSTERRDRHRRPRHLDRGHGHDPAALRRRRAGAVSISQISPGPQELAAVRDRRSESRCAWDSEQPDQLWLGHRDRPNEILIRNPALMVAGRPGGSRAAGWARRRLLRHLLRPFPCRLRGRGSRGGSCTAPPTLRSPTATTRCSSETRSPAAPEGRWVDVDRAPVQPPALTEAAR